MVGSSNTESKGAPAGRWAQAQPQYSRLSPPWLEKGHEEETGEQVPAAGGAAAVSFANK